MGRKLRLSARDRRGAKHRKAGSQNAEKAAACDKSAADAAEAEAANVADIMADMEGLEAAQPAVQPSPATEVKARPNTAAMPTRCSLVRQEAAQHPPASTARSTRSSWAHWPCNQRAGERPLCGVVWPARSLLTRCGCGDRSAGALHVL
eukprot:5478640-Prymnesium_polylepis.1